MNTSTVSTLGSSSISDCINFTGSKLGEVRKAITIEQGARAVKHFEDMGLIRPYTPEEARARASKVKRQSIASTGDDVINEAIKLIGQGSTFCEAAGEVGMNSSTLIWRVQQMGLNKRKIVEAANAK